MQRTKLQTLDRRSSRAPFRRRQNRSRAIAVVGGTLVLILVVGLVAWGLYTLGSRPKSGPTPAASADTGAVKPLAAKAKPETKTAAAEPAPSRPETISVAAVGDMIFDRNVKDLVRAEGGTAPLSDVAAELAKADVAVGNLESVLSERGEPAEGKDTTFQGHPDAIEGLTDAGFDFLSVSNNHTMDYGPDALKDSLTSLDIAGIAHAGAGMDQKAAWKPATYERDGAKTGYLAFSHIVPEGFIALPDRPGMASGLKDRERTMNAIKAAKKTHDYVLVSFHWGVEYEDYSNDQQQQWARDAIDAGADMVLAHHPHVIQGVEFYKNGLIAYSLGDFVFDHYSRKTGEAFILNAQLGPDGVSDVRAVPVYLDGNGKPEYVDGDEADVILKRLRSISEPHGTTTKIADNEARLLP